MSLFYAYLKDMHRDDWSRYLITFANRETADEWWRLISTPPSPYAKHVQRISPQFYAQDKSENNVVDFFQRAGPGARQFLERMFFTLLNDNNARVLSIAPPIKITDHISGRRYLIRSKTDEQKYWYCRISDDCLVCGDPKCDVIHVSSEHRTKFCVQVRNLAIKDYQPPKNFVMLGKDEISIAPSKSTTLYINDSADDLRAARVHQIETPNILFLFEDLKNRFVGHSKKQGNGEIWEYVKVVERGSGDAWELVD